MKGGADLVETAMLGSSQQLRSRRLFLVLKQCVQVRPVGPAQLSCLWKVTFLFSLTVTLLGRFP